MLEVGGIPKLGQSRKSRLRPQGKAWKPYVHGDVKLYLVYASIAYLRKAQQSAVYVFAKGAKNVSEVRFLIPN